MDKYITEFLGTYIVCIITLLVYKYTTNVYEGIIGITLSVILAIAFFSSAEGDFNPVITYINYIDNKRTLTDLISFTFLQYIAALLSILTIKLIF
jgi:glycerol uptake facilitator-like aquaporin